MSDLIVSAPPPKPWVLTDPGVTAASAGGALNGANQVSVLLVTVEVQVTITGMRYRASGTPTGNTQLGVYDINGNLLGSTASGAVVASTTPQTVNLSANVALPPGRYYLAIWQSLNTDNFFRVTGQIGVLPGQLLSGTFAGGLPATITIGNLSNNVAPAIAAVISGGL